MSAYTQFGYPYGAASSQLLIPGQPSAPSTPGTPSTPCCETGRPVATDPVTGQAICSCQYEAGAAGRPGALGGYSRLGAGSSALSYSAAYSGGEQAPYPSIGVDSSYFAAFQGNPYGLKDSGAGEMGVYSGIGSSPAGYGYSAYDPSLYGYGAPYDLAARRKNATRESTGTLKAWLNEHKKNPYPTKGEKIMLAIITKMTLTQVSTWFANARRRLKKENKMTWEPKNKTESDEEADENAESKDKGDKEETDGEKDTSGADGESLSPLTRAEVKAEALSPGALDFQTKAALADGHKPKIWSLADTAVCKTPPPPGAWPTERLGGGGGGYPSATAAAPGPAGYGRYPAPPAAAGYAGTAGGYMTAGYSAGYGESPADTPPLTPPGLKSTAKMAAAHGGGEGGGGGVAGYSGQYSSMAVGGAGRLPTVDRRADPYQAHMSMQQQQQQQLHQQHQQHQQQQHQQQHPQHHLHQQQQQQQPHPHHHQQQPPQQPQHQMPADLGNPYGSGYKDGGQGGAASSSGYVSPV